MIHKYFALVTVTVAVLISSTVRGQENASEDISGLNLIDFSKKVSFNGKTQEVLTFPKTFSVPSSFSMEQKPLQFPAIALDFKNVKPLYINSDFKPTLDYSHYLYCNPNMSSKDLMENMAVDYLVNRSLGSFKLIKSKCNSKK